MVERLAVNEDVAGSSPASPATPCVIMMAKWQMDALRVADRPRDRLPDESFSDYVKRLK